MPHPKLIEALEAAEAAHATAKQASAWAERMNTLTDMLSQLSRFCCVMSVNVSDARSYRVSEETGNAIGQMLVIASRAELNELRGKLESLDCGGTDR